MLTIAIVMKLRPPTYFSLGNQRGAYVTIQGIVKQKQIKNDILVITLSNVNLNQDSKEQGVLCYMKESYQPKMGSTVTLSGKAQTFSMGTNPGEFNQLNYQRSNHIDFKLNQGEILQESIEFSKKKEGLFQLKMKMSKVLEACFHEKNASIMKAMLLGEKGELNKEVKSLYQQNGIAHILAISGLHISILGMGLYKLLRKIVLPIPIAITISIFLIYHYGLMIGMGSSSFRAIFMFSLHLFAIINKRTYDLLTALAIGAVFLLISNPYYIYHTGFLLSFGAIIGIGLLNPLFSKIYENSKRESDKSIYKSKIFSNNCIRKTFVSKIRISKILSKICILKSLLFNDKMNSKIISGFFSSLSVSLITLPILLCTYYEFPIYSILLNLCIIPLMTFLVIGGIMILLIGLLTNWTSIIMGLPCAIILWLYEQLCFLVQAFPFHTWIIGMPEWWQIFSYYGIMLAIICLGERLKAKYLVIGICLSIIFITFEVPKPLSITILDVGQGDGIFMQSEDNTTYLIDAGSTTKKKLATYQLLPFLKYKGVTKLDYVFLTHMDHDHISGVVELLEANRDGSVVLPIINIVLSKTLKQEKALEDETLKELLALAEATDTEIIYMERGDIMKENNLEITCLHPKSTYQSENANDGSLVLSISYHSFDMLLTGDVEGMGEVELVTYMEELERQGELVDYEMIKIAHHGSNSSTIEAFLNIAKGDVGIISCGINNVYGHPHKEVLNRMKESNMRSISTTEEGAITIEIISKKKNGIHSDFYNIISYNE